MASIAPAAAASLSAPAPPPELRRATSALASLRLPRRSPSPRVAAALCRRVVRNTITRATGDVQAEASTELPEIVQTLQDAWDKLEDKYAVASLGVAGLIALWVSTGMISAIDRLPIVPGVLELVGIGYTGWFTYQNLIFKPDREALIENVKSIYGEIIESS